MTDEQLYIDGQLVDINDGTNITLSIASNLFRDIAKMISNKTYTFRLPRTTKNARILQFVDNVSSESTYAYEYHKARYIRGGVELIADGQATILSATATDIEMCVVWGLFPQLSALANGNKTLADLTDDTATITWHDIGTNYIATYNDALLLDYFYAALNFVYRDTAQEWWHNAYDIAPDTTTHADPSKLDYLPPEGSGNVSDIINPSVKISYLLQLIRQQMHVDFHWSGDALATINNLILPLTTRTPTAVSYPDNWRVHFIQNTPHAAGSYTLQIPANSIVSSPYITPTSGSSMTYVVQQDVSVMFKIAARIDWNFEDIIAQMRAKQNPTFVGGFVAVGVKHDGDDTPTYYRAGHYGQPFDKVISWDEINRFEQMSEFVYANGIVDLKQFDEISFIFSTAVVNAIGVPMVGFRPKLEYCTCDVSFSVMDGSDVVPDGAEYPIMANVPNIKVVDMVRCLAAVTGTFPKQPQQGNTEQVTFVPINALWDNMSNAKDWSGKLVAQRGENVPKKIDYNLADWAQNNWYKWKDDDDVTEGYGDGNLQIDNETLDNERNVVEFPFAATQGITIPCNEWNNNGAYKVRKCEARIMTLTADDEGRATGVFDLQMNNILAARYGNLANTLQNITIITETFVLSDFELLNFDETIPVYLRQYGAYFAVLEIKSSKAGIAEVQMLKLN
jgi:hypothetical protein